MDFSSLALACFATRCHAVAWLAAGHLYWSRYMHMGHPTIHRSDNFSHLGLLSYSHKLCIIMHARLEHCPSIGLPTLQATPFLMPWATCEVVGTSGHHVSCKNPSESIGIHLNPYPVEMAQKNGGKTAARQQDAMNFRYTLYDEDRIQFNPISPLGPTVISLAALLDCILQDPWVQNRPSNHQEPFLMFAWCGKIYILQTPVSCGVGQVTL